MRTLHTRSPPWSGPTGWPYSSRPPGRVREGDGDLVIGTYGADTNERDTVWYKDAGTDPMPCLARIFHHPAAAADPGSA